MNSKEQHWHRLTERFEATTDNLGQPLDPKIFEAVVALNALGFRTTASCEGHTEGSYAPYINIAIEYPANEREHVAQALQNAETDEELRSANDLMEKVNEYYLRVRRKLIALLNAFYGDRHIVYDQLLALDPRRGILGFVEELRLQCIGAEDLDIVGEAERAVKCLAYQGEMQRFATFLKEKYFEEE